MSLPTGAPTDQDIVARVLSGHVDDYAHLVLRHQGAVFAICVRALTDRAGAADLTQRTFIKAFDELARYDGSRPFAPWVHTIARNLVRDELRRLERQHRYLGLYRKWAEQKLAPSSSPDGEHNELETALERCIEKLQPAAAQAVHLHYELGLSLSEAADRLGRTVVATRQLLFRAREALRACVEMAGALK